MQQLNLRITERARRHIDDLLRSHPVGSVPALMFGGSQTYSKDECLLSETPWRFCLAVYPPEQAEQIDRDLAPAGYTALYRVGDLTFCIPQATVVTEQVEGATLDVDGDAVRIL